MTGWWRSTVDRHEEAAARGEHDEHCEWRSVELDGITVGVFGLCHCSKRRREAKGFGELPTDDLYFPPPSCTRCDEDLHFDEGWYCETCCVRWSERGDEPEFTDTYGDDLAAESAAWEAAATARHSATRSETPNHEIGD
ncbi:hypothetical protein GCM10027056_00390 [Glaciibacter psychrotolerans]